MAFVTINMLYYTLGVVTFITFIIYLYFKHCYSFWAKLGVPFVKPFLIFGTAYSGLFQKIDGSTELSNLYFDHKKKGHRFFGLYFFQQPALVVMDLELIKNIMIKDFDHFMDRGGYINEKDDPLSAHLFSLSGQKWKNLRMRLTPTFTSGKLKKMFQTLIDCAGELPTCLDSSIEKDEPIDIKSILSMYSTDVIGSVAFGLDCNSFKNPNSEFISASKNAFNPEFWDRLKLFFCVVFPELAKSLHLRASSKNMDEFFRKLVKDTVEYREKNNVTRNDFMQLLIQLKNVGYVEDDIETLERTTIETKLTMNEIAAQAFLFFVAGFETSSTTMAFCLLELVQNIDVQEKARKEIVSVLKKHDGKLTYDSLMEMQYLERVIQETLRKHPPVPQLQRIVTQEYQIPDSDIVLKKNVAVFIPICGLQMDPEYYPNPEKFDPDRFTPEVKANTPDFTYLPFGDGQRVCIGQRFGMLQTKVGICSLLMSYKFTLHPKTKQPITMDPGNFIKAVAGGIHLSAKRVAS